ncbi:MAG: PPC domain-containing protein [Actinomycetota bacterium]|nr:PPC domain-containing protein [Actinomycetota bacterium]
MAALAAFLPSAASAAVPSSGTVGPATSSVAWKGGPFVTSNPSGVCLTSLDPACDTFSLTIVPPALGAEYSVDIGITASAGANDFDLYVYGPDGKRVASSATESGNEKVTLANPVGGTYKVRVIAWFVEPGATYDGAATLTTGPVRIGGEGTVLHAWDKNAAQAGVEVPLRVVLVGFQPGELDTAKILSEIPNFQRPGVLIPRGSSPSPDSATFPLGADTLINHGRSYYRHTKPFLVPYEYKWKPQVIQAPAAFASGLFSAMASSSATGDFSAAGARAYLERYNTARGVYRGTGNQVAAGAPVRFVNGETVEDWIAANSSTYLGFEVGPKAGKNVGPGKTPGYTVFILNTWDSPEAKTILKPQNEYHVFKVNRTDPDTGDFDGIDWARIWGGRYRFMMVDLGAAPNQYEAETWGNRNRSAWGSANYDPPLWEYRANAPRPVTPVNLTEGLEQAVTPGETFDLEYLNFMLGRTVNQATSFRFLHSYLYEPWPGTGQYYLSDNVWHDTHAEVPWPSDLTKLYDQATVIRGLSTLTPYLSFGGDVKFEYLREGGAEYTSDQNMLQQAKANGDDIAGTPFTAMHTPTAMDYIDGSARLSQRGAPCYTSIPGLSVVVEKHYAWALPVIVAGIAPNRNGVPFGYLNSVSDVTKYSGADRDPMLEVAHPQVFSGAFTYTAVHEASHYLGLAHPHDSVGASRNADGSPLYYDGFTWAFNSTAAPTTYSHTELVYNVLDQENIARGHTAYYLNWTDQALEEGGNAFYDKGLTTIASLSPEARSLRKAALDATAKAESLFAKFNFVKATYAAQTAWRNAAAYRDLALGLPAGTSELQKGTKLAGAESCPSAVK